MRNRAEAKPCSTRKGRERAWGKEEMATSGAMTVYSLGGTSMARLLRCHCIDWSVYCISSSSLFGRCQCVSDDSSVQSQVRSTASQLQHNHHSLGHTGERQSAIHHITSHHRGGPAALRCRSSIRTMEKEERRRGQATEITTTSTIKARARITTMRSTFEPSRNAIMTERCTSIDSIPHSRRSFPAPPSHPPIAVPTAASVAWRPAPRPLRER